MGERPMGMMRVLARFILAHAAFLYKFKTFCNFLKLCSVAGMKVIRKEAVAKGVLLINSHSFEFAYG